ncbi:MAG: putative toxin-antitoxin system toxin component, PIN family [Nitrospira sp.]|nr:putative toxin-antitoxin system toxin component, PIN family [Nitrospira sp.]
MWSPVNRCFSNCEKPSLPASERPVPPSLSDIRDFLTLFTSTALVVTAPDVTSALLRDPDDLQVLACALAGEANYIVTGDLDLLHLQSFEGIKIVRPSMFLQLLISPT